MKVLVVVSGEDCNPCARLAALLPALRRRFAGTLRIEERDAAADPTFATRWGVRAVPTLLLFEGEAVIARQQGFHGYAATVRFLAEHAAPAPEPAFAERASAAEAAYEAATRPAAEALGRAIGPAFEAHEALAAALQAEVAAGRLTGTDAQARLEQSQAALHRLGAAELAQQRRVTETALRHYIAAIQHEDARTPS